MTMMTTCSICSPNGILYWEKAWLMVILLHRNSDRVFSLVLGLGVDLQYYTYLCSFFPSPDLFLGFLLLFLLLPDAPQVRRPLNAQPFPQRSYIRIQLLFPVNVNTILGI